MLRIRRSDYTPIAHAAIDLLCARERTKDKCAESFRLLVAYLNYKRFGEPLPRLTPRQEAVITELERVCNFCDKQSRKAKRQA